MTEEDRPTEYVANCPYAWGRGFSAEQAIQTMAKGIERDVDTDESFKFTLTKCYDWDTVSPRGVRADVEDVVYEAVYEVDPELILRLRESAIETSGVAHSVTGQAEEVDRWEPDEESDDD